METTKMALICPLGMTGPVVTETIDALIQKWIGIQPCYTPQQAWPIKNDQIQLLPEFSLDIYCPYTIGAIRYGAIAFPDPGRPQPDENAHLPKYFKRYERHPAQKCVEAVHYLEGYKLAIADQAESVDNTWKKSHKPKVITLDNVRLVGIPVQSWKDSTPGKLLEDVRGPDDNRCFQNLLYGLHHCLHISHDPDVPGRGPKKHVCLRHGVCHDVRKAGYRHGTASAAPEPCTGQRPGT